MRKSIILFCCFLCFVSVFGQVTHSLKSETRKILTEPEKKLLDKADRYYTNQDYLYALGIYDSLYKKHPADLYLRYLLGTCQSYDPYHYEQSEFLIRSADTLRSKLADYDYYLGKACENNDKFEEAVKQYEIYLKNSLPDTLKTIVLHQVEICRNAAEQIKKGAIANINNIGPPLNTEGSEYSPVLPSDERFMVFTYRGPKSKGGKQRIPGKPDEKGTYFEDVFMSNKSQTGGWEIPRPIDAINTVGHDAVMCVSHDGQRLYVFRNVASGNGDIFVSRLKGTEWTAPEKMKGINSTYWEGSMCFTPDEKYLYFSSERPGGSGNRDIWYAQRMPDGNYGNIKSAGPEINTPYDEDAPFITADGKTMFFSSTGHNSTGGYDIFRTDLKGTKWGQAYNIGKPVNTNQDDKYYWVSADGERGYYSSERKGGYGQQDIYLVEPGMFGKPSALIMLNGKVYVDDKPSESEIRIRSKFLRKDFAGTFMSNSSSGDYLINLPAGNEFEVSFNYKGLSISKHISTVGIDSFAPLRSDANLYTPGYLAAIKAKYDSVQAGSDNMKELLISYDDFLAKFGNLKSDSIQFRVQIGAYRIVENFNYRKLIGLPPVLRQIYNDGITRFTMGNFTTLAQADFLCKKAKKAGTRDAFVIAICNNKRITFYQLIHGNYFKE